MEAVAAEVVVEVVAVVIAEVAEVQVEPDKPAIPRLLNNKIIFSYNEHDWKSLTMIKIIACKFDPLIFDSICPT